MKLTNWLENISAPTTALRLLFVFVISAVLSACGGSEENQLPRAKAGTSLAVNEGATVSLNGSGSDSDGTIASFFWTQLSGTNVSLSSANSATPTFTAPEVTATETLVFQLTVTDNDGAIAKDTVTITVENVNQIPSVSAGDNQVVEVNTEVTITGSGNDPDGTIATFSWTQIAGTQVTIMDANNQTMRFTAPAVTEQETLTFELTVTDNEGAAATAQVNVTVNPAGTGILLRAAYLVVMLKQDYLFLTLNLINPIIPVVIVRENTGV